MELPQHPGKPQWKTYNQWKKTVVPNHITISLSIENLQKDMLKKFNLQDESNLGDGAWGEVDLDTNNQRGWGGDFYNSNNSNSNNNSGW
ncbi:unnamed protein product [Cunninghamella blakesleeana]